MNINLWKDLILLKTVGSGNEQRTYTDGQLTAICNEAITQFVADRVFPERNPKNIGIDGSLKRNLDLSPLISSTAYYCVENDDFMLGSRRNGALRIADYDKQLAGVEDDTVGSDKFGVFVPIPDECYHPLSIHATLKKGDKFYDLVKVEKKTHSYYVDNITNTYVSPAANNIWAIEYGNYTPNVGGSVKNLVGYSTRLQADNTRKNITFTTNRVFNVILPKDFQLVSFTMAYIKTPAEVRIATSRPDEQVNCDLHPSVHTEIINMVVDLLAGMAIPLAQRVQVTDNQVKTQS